MIPNTPPTDDEVSRALDVLARAEREQIKNYVNELSGYDERFLAVYQVASKVVLLAVAVADDTFYMAGEQENEGKYKCSDEAQAKWHLDMAQGMCEDGELAQALADGMAPLIEQIKTKVISRP